jgi:hypothetical protein
MAICCARVCISTCGKKRKEKKTKINRRKKLITYIRVTVPVPNILAADVFVTGDFRYTGMG